MGGMQPGDKLTAQNLNDAYMCRTDDTDSTGRIKTDRYFVQGKRDEAATDAQTLVADVGAILLTAPASPTGSEGATTLSPDPTQGAENGQVLNILNCSGGNYSLDFLADPVTLPDGLGASLVYCSTKANWIPIGGTGSGGASCKTIQLAPPAGAVVGNHVYFDGTNWQIGEVTTPDVVGAFYIVELSANTFKIQASGFLEQVGHGYNVGEYYFQAASGGYTDIKPTEGGDVQKDAFYVVDANCLYLLMDNPVLVIEEFGGVTTEQLEFFFRRATLGQTILEGANTAVEFDSSQRTAPYLTSNAAGSLFTVQADGLYRITGRLTIGDSASVGQISEFTASVWINGANISGSLDGNSSNNASVGQNNKQGVTYNALIDLVVGDTIEIIGRVDNSSNVDRPLLVSGVFNDVQILKIGEEPV